MADIEKRYGPHPNDRDALTRKCRLLQSWYRVEVLKEERCGPWCKGGRCVGNVLVDGEQTGANFISPAAFACAREKVAEKQANPDLLIDEYRLFNNMLSSMPLCFNLFADLRSGVSDGSPNATVVLAAMFPQSLMASVQSVEIEMIPRPTRTYIDDKTAFDAAVLFTDESGQPGLAAIETKYSDKLGGNRATRQKRKFELADELGLFTREGQEWYGAKGFDQVARNLLLTLAYARRHQIQNAVNYVLAPAEDAVGRRVVEAIQQRLTKPYRRRITWLPLETVVQLGLAVAEGVLATHLKRFRDRYLDFRPVGQLGRPRSRPAKKSRQRQNSSRESRKTDA